jgi:putrescine transport system substrate-binding protein
MGNESRMNSRTLCLLAILGLVDGRAEAAEEKILNVYNWSDYVAADTIGNFEKRTGIKVNYDVLDSNEILEAKLLTGSSGYDIVVPSGTFLERQIQAGVFGKLDRSKLTNYGNLDEAILEQVAKHDPANAYSVPYLWGTTGFGYNKKKVAKLMPTAPVDSWEMLFKPEVVERLSRCGVSLLDSPTDVYSNVMVYLGRDPNSEKAEDLEAFQELLLKVRPHIKYFHSSQNINDLASGEICVSMGWSGDMFQARDRAAEAGGGIEIAYVIPKEGSMIWFDQVAIPSDAPHPQNAHLFIDYLLEPQVTADLTNAVNFASANKPSLPLVKESIRNDPGVYPPADVMAKLQPDLAQTAKFTRRLTRSWTRIKTGR